MFNFEGTTAVPARYLSLSNWLHIKDDDISTTRVTKRPFQCVIIYSVCVAIGLLRTTVEDLRVKHFYCLHSLFFNQKMSKTFNAFGSAL